MKTVNENVWAFTNWGLVSATIREIVTSRKYPTTYKCDLHIDHEDLNEEVQSIEYGFEFSEAQLFASREEAIRSLEIKSSKEWVNHNEEINKLNKV